MRSASGSFRRKGKDLDGFGVGAPMVLLGIAAQLNASVELVGHYSRTKPPLTSRNVVTLPLGFVYEKITFFLFPGAETNKTFFVKQTQASYKTAELMDVNLGY